MCIIENQQLWFENALSYRTRISENSLPELINFVRSNIDAMDLSITGNIVFTVYEKIKDDDVSILGVEFIIPVDKRFKSSSRYVFKPKFKLENAVLYKYSGKIKALSEAVEALSSYIIQKNLQAITDFYYCVKKITDDTGIIDIYVGINGNQL